MANPNPDSSYFNELLEDEFGRPTEQLLVEEEETETEEDETEEETDEEEDEGEEEEEEEVLIAAVESPPRVSSSNPAVIEDRTKRRREDRGGESCSFSGIESGDCSQGSEWNRTEVDGLFCPICMDAWTNSGDHHISCLPCGHVYGFSCIKRWLQQGRSSGKCPQCNRKSSLKDVRKLFASRIVAIDEESQKKIRSLESKCMSLEKKGAEWCKKEAEWQKRKAELHLEVHQLKQRTIFLEFLLGETQSRPSEFAASTKSCQGQFVSGNFFSDERQFTKKDFILYGFEFFFRCGSEVPTSAQRCAEKDHLVYSSYSLCLFSFEDIQLREGASLDALGHHLFLISWNSSYCMKALRVDGARLFDVDPSSQIILMSRRLPGIGGSGTHLLTKVTFLALTEI
ncbi:hypothetical protein Pint_35720 [Pistacia integerrima]|uniref:Uncharacterized protein n=1 Tax=Pistacia integerrima TaxID=434235 RepID=A0ACC0Y2X4_9ROSI|nr:hypothetical protein Pint_35720 [Pistacia integerrima]